MLIIDDIKDNYSYLNIIVAVVFVAKIVVDFGFESVYNFLPYRDFVISICIYC